MWFTNCVAISTKCTFRYVLTLAKEAMQIDWGEADAVLDGTREHLFVFCTLLAYSCAPFAVCFHKANTEAFREGLHLAFQFFGCVPRRVIWGNAKVTVKSGAGKQAIPQETYAAFAAHYCFQMDLCNVRSGNEKGLVENLVGTIRRNTLSPVPHVASLEALKQRIAETCTQYIRTHRIANRQRSVAEMFTEDQSRLSPLPQIPYDFRKVEICRISSCSTARFQTNNYSVPALYARREATVRASAEKVEIYVDGQIVANHKRCYKHHQSIYSLAHYLPLLERRPCSILQAQPVKQNLSGKLLSLLESTRLPAKRFIAVLKYCAENGETVFWQHRNEFMGRNSEKPKIENPINVQDVDLSQYDSFLMDGGASCRLQG